MRHFIYIIENESGILYKGYSTAPDSRLMQHNNDESRYTAGKGPWRLVYIEELATKKEALQREKALKKANSGYLRWLIRKYQNEISGNSE